MTGENETELAGPSTVGNYFIATYPPFSAWTSGQVGAVHRVLGEKPEEHTDLGLYLHIPFCRKRCHFCYFKVYTDRTKDEIAAYVDALACEIASYAEKPAIEGRPPAFSPEHDDCARIAAEQGVALRAVYEAAQAAYRGGSQPARE